MASGPEKYGRYHWCVKTKESKSGEIYVNADDARVLCDGTLTFIRGMGAGIEMINLALAAGTWTAVYAASAADGSAVVVEHWEGEVDR